MHVVNLRLAMVYGSGGRGNLERMGRLVGRGLFPPLPETGNHRSLVHVDDVVAAMRLVADDDRANGGTYIVASSEAPSGRELFDMLRSTLGMRRCSWVLPEWLLRAAASGADGLEAILERRMPFDSEVLDRLLGSAWYSPARIAREPVSYTHLDVYKRKAHTSKSSARRASKCCCFPTVLMNGSPVI